MIPVFLITIFLQNFKLVNYRTGAYSGLNRMEIFFVSAIFFPLRVAEIHWPELFLTNRTASFSKSGSAPITTEMSLIFPYVCFLIFRYSFLMYFLSISIAFCYSCMYSAKSFAGLLTAKNNFLLSISFPRRMSECKMQIVLLLCVYNT